MRIKNRCPHVNVRGIYGDEVNHRGGYRLQCRDCGRLLDGPVSIAVERGRRIIVPLTVLLRGLVYGQGPVLFGG